MKNATISSGGKSCRIGPGLLASLKLMRVDAKNADQIETTEVTWQSGDEEPGMMVIPTMMWEGMLETIGAGAPVVAAELPEEEISVEQAEGLDAEDDEEKTDSKIARVVAREVKVQIDAMNRKRQTLDALTATVNHDAGRILPPGYDYSVGWRQTALDAIAKSDPELEARAKQLVTKSRNGDAMASGALTEMLRARAAESGQGVQIQNVEIVNSDAAEPWASAEMPESEKIQ